MLGSFHDAEEVTQDTLLRGWMALGTYEARAPLHHWLYRIATTTCLMMIRTATRRPQTVNEVSYWLRFTRATIVAKATGLSESQLRAHPVASTTTIGGLVTHLVTVDQHWFSIVLGG
jgi:DNA-directed RNA polymerase specialized sigma24 family protein